MVEENKGVSTSKKKIEEYVFLESQANWKRLYDLIVELNLRPYCFQHKENRYTCWYVGFVDIQKPYILHFKINKTSLALWFRRPHFLSKLGKEKSKPIYSITNLLAQNTFNFKDQIKYNQKITLI